MIEEFMKSIFKKNSKSIFSIVGAGYPEFIEDIPELNIEFWKRAITYNLDVLEFLESPFIDDVSFWLEMVP